MKLHVAIEAARAFLKDQNLISITIDGERIDRQALLAVLASSYYYRRKKDERDTQEDSDAVLKKRITRLEETVVRLMGSIRTLGDIHQIDAQSDRRMRTIRKARPRKKAKPLRR